MTEQVNLRLKQSIKGNKLSNKSSIRNKLKMRFILPADVIIRLRTHKRKQTPQEEPQQKAQTPQETEGESNDK